MAQRKSLSNMKRWAGRVALVTGVCNSTGKAVAEILARDGMNVVGVDDNQELDSLDVLVQTLKSEHAQGSLTLFKCDIKNIESINKVFRSIKQDPDIEGVDVVVHCGVLALGESILDGNPQVWKEMLDANILGPAYISQEAFRSMKERGVDDGHIIFDNGLVSQRLVPGNKALHFLSATKFACKAMLEGIRHELRLDNSNIRVSAISSGVIETDILDKLFLGDAQHAESYLGGKKYLDVKDIANTVIFILEQPPHVQIHDVLIRATSQIP